MELVWVRSTVNLAGMPLGREALVNPEEPYIAECLATGYLVRLPTEPETNEEPVAEEQGEASPPDPSAVVEDD